MKSQLAIVIVLATLTLLSQYFGVAVCQPTFQEGTAKSEELVAGLSLYDLTAYLDWSLSADKEILTATVGDVLEIVPVLAKRRTLGRIQLYAFGSDGWKSKRILTMDIYTGNTQGAAYETKPKQNDSDEIEIILRKQFQDYYDQMRISRQLEAKQIYEEKVDSGFKELPVTSLLPPPDYPEPPCTDLNGVLKRISSTYSDKIQLVAVITDGEENCDSTIRPLPIPENPVALVIVLVPEKTDKLSYKLSKTRTDMILRAAPWAVVVPFFETHNLGDAFEAALERWKALRYHD